MAKKRKLQTNTTRELFDLCYNADSRENEKAWRQLRQWLSFYQNDKQRFKEAAAYPNTFNWTPLHVLVSRSPPLDVVETLVKHAPETLRMKTVEGDLPLHIACGQRASPEIIKILVAAYPESVRVTNNAGGLPLHFVCYNRHSLDVLNLLLQVYPESIRVECVTRTGENLQPSEILKNKNQFDSENENERIFFLHQAVADGLSVHLVKLLIEAFPDSCTIHDSNGMIPLHHALKIQRANWVDIAALLLTASPKSETIEDSNGVTPSQLLKQAASRKDDNGKLLLHHQATGPKGFTENSLMMLFRANPEAVALPDNKGMLPFFHACLNKASSLETLMLFVKLYPESIVLNK